jgi:hypothetical protein
VCRRSATLRAPRRFAASAWRHRSCRLARHPRAGASSRRGAPQRIARTRCAARAHGLAARRAQAGEVDAALDVLWQSGLELCIFAMFATLAKKARTIEERQDKLREECDAHINELLREQAALSQKMAALQLEVAAAIERVDEAEVKNTVYFALLEQLSETRIRQLLAENAMLRALLDAK